MCSIEKLGTNKKSPSTRVVANINVTNISMWFQMHLNEQLNVYRTFLIISFKYVYYEVDKSTDSLYQANTGYCVAKI